MANIGLTMIKMMTVLLLVYCILILYDFEDFGRRFWKEVD